MENIFDALGAEGTEWSQQQLEVWRKRQGGREDERERKEGEREREEGWDVSDRKIIWRAYSLSKDFVTEHLTYFVLPVN